MNRMRFTREMRDFVKQYVQGRPYRELAAMFNEHFGTDVTVRAMQMLCFRMGLRNEVRNRQHLYTAEQAEWLEAHVSGRAYDELADLFNRRFGTNVLPGAVQTFCWRHGWRNGMKGRDEASRRHQFKPGELPWNTGTRGQGVCKPNSGSFRPGHNLHAKPVGTLIERKGEAFVKVAQPDVWRRAGHAVLEREQGAPLPPGMVVLYADGDKSNLSPDNLLAMSRAEHGYMHKANLKFADAELTKAGLVLAKLQLKLGERRREAKP